MTTPPPGHDLDALARTVTDMLAAAVARDTDRAADLLDQLGQASDGDPVLMFSICCGIAGAGEGALRRIYGSQAPDPARGGMWAIEELSSGALAADPAAGFASRFLIAYANDDRENALALHTAALTAPGTQYVDSVCALLADVAGLLRAARDTEQQRSTKTATRPRSSRRARRRPGGRR